ncbi:MAG: glycoside hydrolase domain-containing protein [Thermoguttaceae bacterium]
MRRPMLPRLTLLAAGLALAGLARPGCGQEVRDHPRYEWDEPAASSAVPNLFRGAKVSVSGHWADCVGELAVDGRHDDPSRHWGCDKPPFCLTVELAASRPINTIHLWTFWNNKRSYQYVVEGSLDGASWKMLADQRDNRAPATAQGQRLRFPRTEVKYVRTTFAGNSEAANAHIVEIEGRDIPDAILQEEDAREAAWKKVKPGLHAVFGSVDLRYARGEVPHADARRSWSATAWRGERLSTQLVLWSRSEVEQVRCTAAPLAGNRGSRIDASCVRPRFVRYVLADQGPGGPPSLAPDVLDTMPRLDLAPCTVRPVWVSVDVPRDAVAGLYRGYIEVAAVGVAALRLPLEVEVLPLTVPPPEQWTFRLDLWQDPWSVAQYHGLEPWSEAHWKVLEPHLRMLAQAGQKFITTYITPMTWGESTFINNGTMVEWLRRRDGSFRFDYTALDRYVEFAQRCGITKAITCYSMVPWGRRCRYQDEATGDYVWTKPVPGTPEYKSLWTPFLKDFAEHLRQRGWFEKTYMGINENPLKEGQACTELIRAVAPGLKVTWAGQYHEQLKNDIDDWCFFISPAVDRAVLADRARQRRTTTFYVCCGPERPNNFTFSPPSESAWMGWYAAAQGYDGFLRWAYDSWVQNPLLDTRYVRWPAGDCFLVYPGARSSIRFERLREGIVDYEKIRILRSKLSSLQAHSAAKALSRLDAALAAFTWPTSQKVPAAETVKRAQQALLDVARQSVADMPP